MGSSQQGQDNKTRICSRPVGTWGFPPVIPCRTYLRTYELGSCPMFGHGYTCTLVREVQELLSSMAPISQVPGGSRYLQGELQRRTSALQMSLSNTSIGIINMARSWTHKNHGTTSTTAKVAGRVASQSTEYISFPPQTPKPTLPKRSKQTRSKRFLKTYGSTPDLSRSGQSTGPRAPPALTVDQGAAASQW